MGVLRFSLIWWKNVCSAHWRIFMSGSCGSQQIHSVLHYTEKEKTKTKKHSHIHPPCTQSTESFNHFHILKYLEDVKWINESMTCQVTILVNACGFSIFGQIFGRFLGWKKQTSLDMLWMDQWGVKGGPWSFCRFNYCIPWKRDGNLNRKCIWTNQWFLGAHSLVFGGS